jgi:hypothetical protein
MSLRPNLLSDSAAYLTIFAKRCERNTSGGWSSQPVSIPVFPSGEGGMSFPDIAADEESGDSRPPARRWVSYSIHERNLRSFSFNRYTGRG